MTWLCESCVDQYDVLAFVVSPKEDEIYEDCGKETECVDYSFEEGVMDIHCPICNNKLNVFQYSNIASLEKVTIVDCEYCKYSTVTRIPLADFVHLPVKPTDILQNAFAGQAEEHEKTKVMESIMRELEIITGSKGSK